MSRFDTTTERDTSLDSTRDGLISYNRALQMGLINEVKGTFTDRHTGDVLDLSIAIRENLIYDVPIKFAKEGTTEVITKTKESIVKYNFGKTDQEKEPEPSLNGYDSESTEKTEEEEEHFSESWQKQTVETTTVSKLDIERPDGPPITVTTTTVSLPGHEDKKKVQVNMDGYTTRKGYTLNSDGSVTHQKTGAKFTLAQALKIGIIKADPHYKEVKQPSVVTKTTKMQQAMREETVLEASSRTLSSLETSNVLRSVEPTSRDREAPSRVAPPMQTSRVLTSPQTISRDGGEDMVDDLILCTVIHL